MDELRDEQDARERELAEASRAEKDEEDDMKSPQEELKDDVGPLFSFSFFSLPSIGSPTGP